jgi:putative MATE family efflux protein
MARIGGPAILSSLIFTLYNLTDAFWIGRLPAQTSAAIMAGMQVSWPIVWFLISLVAGFGGAAVTALVAQYVGAGREDEARFAVNQLFSLAVITGAAVGLLGYLISPLLLGLLVTDVQVARAANTYLRVIFLGLPAMMVPGLFQFALAATGDTVTPLWVNGGATFLNIALDPFLILGLGPFPKLGILGAALATVFAEAVATAVFLYLFFRGKGVAKLSLHHARPRWPWVKRALKIGFPAAIGQSSTAFGFVVMTGVIGRLPEAEIALAGYGIADRLIGILFIITDGLGTGLTTMVGQALGAHRMERAREVLHKGLSALTVILASEAFALWLVRRGVMELFIPGRPDVIAVGASFIQAFVVGMPLLGVFFTAMAIYRGAGHNVPTMLLSLLRLWVVRIPLAYFMGFTLKMGADGIWWGMSLSNILAGLVSVGLLISRSWQRSLVDEPVRT